ncbi:MAG: tRNA 2-thiouridine(34) synthase MnmA [Desulfobulbaceae bacterium]|nr:tRNA 2-thiouridine(34) synthase MnmA [Desulfobulbaceae bacterium]
MTALKIGVAMSGGVDSTVTAALLAEQGHRVHGYFMRLPLPGMDEHIKRLRLLTERLAIPLRILELEDFFKQTVIEHFISTYLAGRTPNPCIFCNHTVKFGRLFSVMRADGMDKGATGHYARVVKDGEYRLLRGIDPAKDQSYFLCRLDPEQLSHIVFPLGTTRKKEVYRKALELGFTDFEGRESQDVCFMAGKSVSDFFKEQGIPEKKGDIVSTAGRFLGTHRGIWHYTIGQRRGLSIPDATPWYVTRMDGTHNRLIVGKHQELFSTSLLLEDVQMLSSTFHLPWRGTIQLRSRHTPCPVTVISKGCGWSVTFEQPQRAVTPGQYAALYENDRIVGSGIISKADPKSGEISS